MRSEVARLSALVQRILEYSRLQQQRGYEFERVDLTALVNERSRRRAEPLEPQFSFVVDVHGPRP